ncbi:ArsR family transcriptional regulator [Enterococcus faecalis]|nr:ArsR family transcriptional regulator [Enterococcus faecalis]
MNGFPDLEKVTKTLADPSRLNILTTLIDGKFHTVNELAKNAKIKSHTASYHLKQLYELNWISSHKQGKHVYYRLCSEDIAELLEKLMNLSPIKKIQSFNQNSEYQKLKEGRSCYKHLAGKLGVSFFNYLIKHQFIEWENDSLILTDRGFHYFESIGVNILYIKKQSGIFIKPCLDWTERDFHLSGNLGKAFFNLCEEKKYITTNTANRSVRLTSSGEQFFLLFNS